MRLPILLALALLAWPAEAQSPLPITLAGRAQTGADARDVRFEFVCAPAGRHPASLLVRLHVPNHDQLRPVFDFDSFEGPDANAGPRTRLDASGGPSARFSVSGLIGVEADNPFVFGLSATRGGDGSRMASLVRVLRPLAAGPGTLNWTQENTRSRGPAIMARLEVGAEAAARLRAALGPCLGR